MCWGERKVGSWSQRSSGAAPPTRWAKGPGLSVGQHRLPPVQLLSGTRLQDGGTSRGCAVIKTPGNVRFLTLSFQPNIQRLDHNFHFLCRRLTRSGEREKWWQGGGPGPSCASGPGTFKQRLEPAPHCPSSLPTPGAVLLRPDAVHPEVSVNSLARYRPGWGCSSLFTYTLVPSRAPFHLGGMTQRLRDYFAAGQKGCLCPHLTLNIWG